MNVDPGTSTIAIESRKDLRHGVPIWSPAFSLPFFMCFDRVAISLKLGFALWDADATLSSSFTSFFTDNIVLSQSRKEQVCLWLQTQSRMSQSCEVGTRIGGLLLVSHQVALQCTCGWPDPTYKHCAPCTERTSQWHDCFSEYICRFNHGSTSCFFKTWEKWGDPSSNRLFSHWQALSQCLNTCFPAGGH